MSELRLSDHDIRLLRRNGLTPKDIRFLSSYLTDREFSDLLKELASGDNVEAARKYDEKIQKIEERNYRKECKCAVGDLVIDRMFELGIINDYHDILVKNTNRLTEDVQSYVDDILYGDRLASDLKDFL